MKCQNCGHENPASIAFCENCGELMSRKQNAKGNGNGAWGFIRDNAEEIDKDLGAEELDFDTEDIDELEMKFMDGVEDWASMPGNSSSKPAKPAKPVQTEQPAENEPPRKRNLFDEADRFAKDGKTAARATEAEEIVKPAKTEEKAQPVKQPKPVEPVRRATQQRSSQPAKREQPAPVRQQSRKPAENTNNRSKSGSTGGKFKRLLPFIIVGAVILALIVGIVAMLSKGIGSSGVKTTEANIDPNNPNKYNITVRAKEGTVLVYETSSGSRSEHTVSHKNYIIFNVGTAELLPVEPIEGETISVTPKIYVKAADGELKPIEIDPIEIKVPQLSISFSTPDSFTAEEGNVEIKGRITNSDQYGAELTLNGEKLEVGEDGSFTYTDKLDQQGDHPLDFSAKLGGYAIYHKTFTATVQESPDVTKIIEIPESFENYTRLTNDDTYITISGTAPKGSTLSVISSDPDFSLKSEPEIDENGNFSITVNMPTAEKSYPFTIIAVTPSGTEYRRDFCVERPPVYSVYVQRCWAENFDEMSKPVRVESKQPFRFKCTITEITYDGDYIVARATLSTAPDTVIEIEYHDHYANASHLEVGEEYVMSGYSMGKDDEGMLHMYIWFVDDKH
ncbi:MAG: hypothetical protein II724_00900 [Clostridia bacterium]|nr:hypothetical protein [Clostridia bacterium]